MKKIRPGQKVLFPFGDDDLRGTVKQVQPLHSNQAPKGQQDYERVLVQFIHPITGLLSTEWVHIDDLEIL